MVLNANNKTLLTVLFGLVTLSLFISGMCMNSEWFEGDSVKTVADSAPEVVGRDLEVSTGNAPVVRPSPADQATLARNMPQTEPVPSLEVEKSFKSDGKGKTKTGYDYENVGAVSSFDAWDGATPGMLGSENEAVLPGDDQYKRFVNSDLLPKEDPKFDDSFGELAPEALKGQEFIDPSRHMVYSEPLRNTNYSIRSEPANPVQERDVSAGWMLSTIRPDAMRRPLEIGPTVSA